MNANEMIDRYVREVGRHLPRRGRADIERELRSLLQDAVEERAAGEPATDLTVVKVLTDFGSPETMAAQYHSQQVAIGSRLFPVFRLVVTVVLAVMAVLHVVLMVLALVGGDSAEPVSTIWNLLLNFGQSALVSIGVITLIFLAIERFAGHELDALAESAEWDPYELPPVDDPSRINRGEVLAEIVFTIIFTGVFLWLIAPDGVLGSFVAAEIRPIIPWMVASTAVEVMLKVVVFAQGRWTRSTRFLEIGTELFGLYVLFLALRVGTFTTVGLLDIVIRFALYIAAIVNVIGVFVKLFRLLTGRAVPPSPSGTGRAVPTA